MADMLPINFSYLEESAIKSYPYNEISEGTGYVHYMASRMQIDNNSANDKFILVTSSSVYTQEASGEPKTNLHSNVEVNFDVQFNTPKILNGKIYFVLAYEMGGTATTPTIRILKWDGSTETELVAAVALQALPTTGQQAWTGYVTISNKKINSGESLRVELTHATNGTVYLMHDPTASISANPVGGRTSFFVPFKILD